MELNNEALLESVSKHGFLAAPRNLLEAALRGDEQARVLAVILLEVNFADREAGSGGRRYLCRRGESILSLSQWSQRLGLHIPQVKYYFNAFTTAGILERIDTPLHGGHIRVARYDGLTGRAHAATESYTGGKAADEKDTLFDHFWELYHRITGRAPLERYLTRLCWNELTPEEQEQAYDNFPAYYDALEQKEYCRKPAMYLRNKSFI
jgi:AraC-like DNA-binding protein